MTYDVILPAGGRIDPKLANEAGTDIKALIKFGDQTILERTLNALQASGRVRRTVVIGAEEVRSSRGGQMATMTLHEGKSGPENILNGLKALLNTEDPPSKVIVATSDLPFLTPEIIQNFIDLCPQDRDIAVPLISRKEWNATYPNSSATFVKLADDEWTTGCVYILDAIALQKAMPQIEQVFNNRKSPLGMAKLLGPKFLYLFLTKRLTVADIEVKIEGMLGVTGAAVRHSPPELAYDIDFLDDYQYAVQHVLKTS